MLANNESLAISGRRDVRALISEWTDPKKAILPSSAAEDMFRNAENHDIISNEKAVEECCQSCTYVTLQDAIKLHKANKERRGRVVQVVEKEQLVDCHYVPPWPSVTINVHPFDLWGCEFPLLSSMHLKDVDCHLLWSLSGMLAGLPAIWERTDAHVSNVTDWSGWTLAFVGPMLFPNQRRSQNSQIYT